MRTRIAGGLGLQEGWDCRRARVRVTMNSEGSSFAIMSCMTPWGRGRGRGRVCARVRGRVQGRVRGRDAVMMPSCYVLMLS